MAYTNSITVYPTNTSAIPYVYWIISWNAGENRWRVTAKKANGYFTGGSWTVTILLDNGGTGSTTVNAPIGDSTESSGNITINTLPSTSNYIYLQATSVNFTESGLYEGNTGGIYTPPAAPQASTMSCSSAVNLGSNIDIRITSESTLYDHLIEYSMDNSTWTTFQSGIRVTSADVPYSVAFNTSSLSGYFTDQSQRDIYIRCTTSNSGSTIGNAVTARCTITASSTPPLVELTLIRHTENQTASSWNRYIQQYSQVYVGIKYTLYNGASFVSCKTVIDGVEYTSAYDATYSQYNLMAKSAIFLTSGRKNISVTVTDSRGAYYTKETSINVTAYEIPNIISYSAIRYSNNVNTEDAEGTNLSAKAKMTYASVSNNNTSSLLVRYKESGGSWSNAITLTNGSYGNTQINLTSGGTVNPTSPDKSYIVQFIACDSLHPYSNIDASDNKPTILTITITTNSVVFHAKDGGGGFSIGGYCDPSKSSAFEVAYDTYLRGKLILSASILTSNPTYAGTEGELVFVIGTSGVTPKIYYNGSWH